MLDRPAFQPMSMLGETVCSTLRGLYIPKGVHQITLEFKPDDIYLGNMIASASANSDSLVELSE